MDRQTDSAGWAYKKIAKYANFRNNGARVMIFDSLDGKEVGAVLVLWRYLDIHDTESNFVRNNI